MEEKDTYTIDAGIIATPTHINNEDGYYAVKLPGGYTWHRDGTLTDSEGNQCKIVVIEG